MSLRTAFFILILMCIRYYGFSTITMKEMSASVENGVPVIRWTTSAELNNKRFVIERSADCIHFCQVGSLKGEVNSTTERNYAFTDEAPLKGVSYYRIVSVDIQENQSPSGILPLDNRANSISNSVFPCPFKDEVNIKLKTEELPANCEVIIYGNSGRQLYSCPAAQEIKLDLSYLTKGTYYVTVQDNGRRLMEKKILKNED